MDEIITKKCTKCGEVKTADGFYKKKSGRYGIDSRCKKCVDKISKKWALGHPEEKKRIALNWWRRNPPTKEKAAKWRRSHLDRDRENHKKWEKAHPEKIKEYKRRTYAKNVEKAHERSRKWHRENIEKIYEYNRKRRALKKGAIGNVTAQEWTETIAKYGNKCLCCGRTDVKLAQDHIVPLSKGGTHTIDNVQPLCQSCNSKKRTNTIDYRR